MATRNTSRRLRDFPGLRDSIRGAVKKALQQMDGQRTQVVRTGIQTVGAADTSEGRERQEAPEGRFATGQKAPS